MKKLVYSALALSVTSAGALASDTDWSTLDQEIEALTASTSLDNHGPHIGGRIRTWYQSESDTDTGDFDVVDARVHAAGSHGDYGYKVQVDFAGEPNLLDAYVDFAIGGQVNARMGQFKAGLSRSALISSGNLFFTDRNNAGSSWGTRTEGLMLSGDFDQLGWWITLMDGADGAGDDYLMTAKVDFDVMGDGASSVEGAYGGSESPSLTIGIGMWDDGGADDTDGTLIEVHGGTNVWSIGVDMQSAGDAAQITQGAGYADASPMSIMGTYMLQPDTWELGVRLEDEDNDADESTMTIGVNNYLDGHGLKWGFEMASTSSDDAAMQTDTIRISLNCAF
jgi:hypothetical protein